MAPIAISANPIHFNISSVLNIIHLPSDILHQTSPLLFFGSNELIALTVNVDNLNLRIVLQVLAQLGNIDVHGAGIEVVVVYPDSLQGEVALQNLIGMRAEQSQKFVLFGRQLGLLLANRKELLLGIEGELTNMIER